MLTVEAPASKSLSHRMLMAAALTNDSSVVSRVLMSHDIECTINVLTNIGARISLLRNNSQQGQGVGNFLITGIDTPLGINVGPAPISCDMHESGTSCRLLTAILSTCDGFFRVHGAPRMHERPMHDLTKALMHLGTSIIFQEQEGHAPFLLQGKSSTHHNTSHEIQNEIVISCNASSQYLSGLLLAAPRVSGGLTITLGGSKVVSWPYVVLTLQTLQDFNVPFYVQQYIDGNWQEVDWQSLEAAIPGETRFCVPEGRFHAGEYFVEGDWSGASYFIAAGALGSQPVMIKGLNAESRQGDRAIIDILKQMGGAFSFDSTDDKELVVYPSKLHGVTVDMGACPDLVPTVAVMAAFATGETIIRNCEHLRIKESDRIAAPAMELRKVGVTVEELSDGLRITGLGQVPTFAKETKFCTHNDHRIAMSLALLGLHGQEPQMDDVSVVKKSFPHFWDEWRKLYV